MDWLRRACENMAETLSLFYTPELEYSQPHSSIETHQVKLAATLTQEEATSTVAVLQTSNPAYSETDIEAVKNGSSNRPIVEVNQSQRTYLSRLLSVEQLYVVTLRA